MGLFSARKGSRQTKRVEPRLYAAAKRVTEPSRHKSRAKRPRRTFLGSVFRFCFTLGLIGLFGLAAIFGYIWVSLNQNGLLKIPHREPGLMVLAADGTVLAEQGSFYGDQAQLRELPDYVPNAVIAIEDRRFRFHFGIDPVGLARALYTNFRSGRVVQGGSTLTQQLAKNLFLTQDRTIQRKLQEVVLAVWLETKFSKDEILQLYLNRVYYGSGATGIEKAAQAYYSKPAAELTITEAATLAGVLKAPTNYNPSTRPEAAAERAQLVIQSMVDAGFITAEEAQAASDAPASVKASDYVPATQYIVDWVNEQLPELVKGYDQSIVIETTIDPQLQYFAERTLRNRLNKDGAKLDVSQAALVVMDAGGAVLAMVGGKSYKRSQFNRVTKAKRQPGSAFKPFLYLAALEQGFTPDSVEIDEPVRIGDWQPENYRQKYLGAVTLERALALSLNTVAAKLGQAVGPGRVADMAHRLGVNSALGNDASISLGTSEVTLLELAGAFTPFANGGFPVAPYAVKRISARDGRVLYERSGTGFAQAITGYDLGALNRMMRAVVTYGTGKSAGFGGFDIGGKTGTSQDYRDAWFIGYTSGKVAGVWAGNDDNSPTRKVTGGSLPAAIWREVMQAALVGHTPEPLPGETGPAPAVPVSVSQAEPPQEVRRVGRTKQDGGLFESIGSLFGGSERTSDGKPRKKNLTAFERMKRAQEER